MGTGDSQRDSRESISRESFALEAPIFIARQADSHESLEFSIRANRFRANHATKSAIFWVRGTSNRTLLQPEQKELQFEIISARTLSALFCSGIGVVLGRQNLPFIRSSLPFSFFFHFLLLFRFVLVSSSSSSRGRNPARVRKESRKSPPESQKSAPWSTKESETSWRNLSGLWGAPPRGILSRLLSDSSGIPCPEGPGRPYACFSGARGTSAFSAFSPYRVRIADFENPTNRLYYDRP